MWSYSACIIYLGISDAVIVMQQVLRSRLIAGKEKSYLCTSEKFELNER